MKILEYIDLDTSRVKASYRKVADAIARHDFRAAQVKKLANLSHGKFYRAKLDDADRLLFSLIRYGDEVCAKIETRNEKSATFSSRLPSRYSLLI